MTRRRNPADTPTGTAPEPGTRPPGATPPKADGATAREVKPAAAQSVDLPPDEVPLEEASPGVPPEEIVPEVPHDELTASELPADFYRTIVDRAPILVAVDVDGVQRWRSPAAVQLFGRQYRKPLIDTIRKIVHPADLPEALQRLADPSLLTEPYELRLRTSDGKWRAVSFVAADLRDHPAVGGVAFYGADVTRARAAEDRERGESARLIALLHSLAAGVLAEDDEHRVVLANPALVDMLGLHTPPSALIGAQLGGATPADVDLSGWLALTQVTAPGSGTQHELPQGRVVETVCTGITVNGGSLGRLWVLHDVTASVAARRALEEHNQQLAALSALKSEFIAIVSHELRTPLTSIASFTEMLTGPGELTSSDAPLAVAAIARNTDRMLTLLSDLRLLSQLETGDQAVATGAVDLADLTREVGDGIDAGGRVVAVRHETSPGPRLDGDEQLLRQLVHAVAGTVAACAAADEMTLSATADDSGWTLRATAPSGEFATDEQLLATPLPVLDDASRQRSAALSVLLARAIAQGHGGTLVAQVRPGDTATITVRLPLARPHGLSRHMY